MVNGQAEEYLTVAEAAARLKVSGETVRTWLKRGLLDGRRVGLRAFRISSRSVEALLAGSTATAATAQEEER